MIDYYVKPTGNDTTGTGSAGAPYATPGKALGVAIAGAAGWRIFVEAGTYLITSTTANIAGGRLNFTQAGTKPEWNRMIGHAVGNTAVADRFTLSIGSGLNVLAATLGILSTPVSFISIENANIIGNATSGSRAINASGVNQCRNFTVSGFTGGAVSLVTQQNGSIISDFSIDCGGIANTNGLLISTTSYTLDGVVFNNVGNGISAQATAELVNVRSYGHTGASGYGFRCSGNSNVVFRNCIAANNGADNFYLADANETAQLFSCIADGGSGYSFGNNSTTDQMALVHCAAKAASTGLYPVTPSILESFSTLSVSPFVNAAGGDFHLTDAAKTILYAGGFNIPSSWLQNLNSGTPRGVLSTGPL